MEDLRVKLSQYNAYKENPTPHNESNLKGQIYEFYCYNNIIEKFNRINIIKSYLVKKEKFGNFFYNTLGKINYHSNSIHLAEFDILGYNENNLYFWEITKSEQGKKILRNEIERKKELLKRIFPKMNIIFKLILPKILAGYECYNIEIIKEPNYDNLINCEYLKLSNYYRKCIHLKNISNIAVDYDYINEIINLSHLYFDSFNKENLHNQHLIERIYNIKDIKNSKFAYYSIENKKYGTITINGNNIFKDKIRVKSRKKCFQEIRLIKQIIKANEHFT
jgi:hypothetical protein